MVYNNDDSTIFGAWRNSNGQPYLEIQAPDNYTLGTLEGKFLKKKILFFKYIIKVMKIPFLTKGFSYNNWIKLSRMHADAYPSKYEEEISNLKDELRGIADTIQGISYDDLLVQNSFIELLYGELVPNPKKRIYDNMELGCTSFGFKQKDGNTLIGQNFDFNRFMLKPAVSFVKHKLPDKPEIFSFRLGGMLALPAGKNSYGVKMNVNIVKSLIQQRHIFPTGMRTRIGYNMKTAKEVHDILISSFPEAICYNLLIADKKDLISCEISPKYIARSNIQDWVVKSNIFITEKLKKYLAFPDYSRERQKYGEIKAKELFENGLSEKNLLKLLSDKPIICRINTVAFFTDNYFGVGNPRKNPHGKVPI